MAIGKLENLKDKIGRLKHEKEGFEDVDWKNVDSALFAGLISEVGRKGGAVRFGYSRRQDVYSLGLYYREEVVTIWFRPDDDIDKRLRIVMDFFESEPEYVPPENYKTR